MNKLNEPDTTANPGPDGAWSRDDHHVQVPDTSLLPEANSGGAPAVDLMKRVVRGTHAAIDDFAASAAPTVRLAGNTVSDAQDMARTKAGQLRGAGEAWVEGTRSTVRRNPLTCVVAALAVGALLSRVRR